MISIAGPPWNFKFSVVSTPVVHQFVNYSPGFPTLYCTSRVQLGGEVYSSKLRVSIFTCLSLQLGRGSGLPCDLTSLTGLRRVADFQFVCFLFVLGPRAGGGFSASYIPDEKMEVYYLFAPQVFIDTYFF
jgi:hypothetical protein